MDIVKDSIKLSEESANNITSKIEKIVNTINKETELNILKQVKSIDNMTTYCKKILTETINTDFKNFQEKIKE